MEKLLKLNRYVLFITLLIGFSAFSQETLCVVETCGNPHVQDKNLYKSINKGDVFNGTSTIQLEYNETIKLIDEHGELYHLNHPGTFTLKKVLSEKVSNNTASVTKKYFNYLYKKMINDYKKNSNTGVVYRTKILGELMYPKNNRLIVNDTIHFEWMNDKHQPLHFKLTDVSTKKELIISSNGNYITLAVDNNFIKLGKKYSWSVFDDKHSSEIHSFSVLSNENKKDLKTKIEVFTKELTQLEFSKERIQSLVADYYNIQL